MEKPAKTPTKQQNKHYPISAKSRRYFTQNLAVMLKAAVPIGQVLGSFKKSARSRTVKRALGDVEEKIDSGYSLYEALDNTGLVSRATLALIDIGESSGNLSENLQVAAQQEEKDQRLRAKVRSALIYPGFVISITLIVGVGITWYLLPKLAVTFDRLNTDLPLITKIMLGLGDFLEKNGIWFVPSLLGGLALLGYLLFLAPGVRAVGQSLLFRTPGIARLIKEVEIARFGYLFGTLLDSGLNVTDALAMLQRASSSKPYQKLYAHFLTSFENGYSFKSSMENYRGIDKLIPSEVQQILIASEASGALAETLRSVGENYEERADITAKNLEAILEPLLLIVVWLGVLAVAVSVILPIYNLVGGIGG